MILKYDYTYDVSGNILGEKSKQGVSSFTYDKNNQLIQEELPDGTINKYSYDDVGNHKERTRGDKTDIFTYNAANQIANKNNIVFKYDSDGNLVQDEHHKYEYNALGYQTRVTDLKGEEVARYEYDETGMRTKKIMGSKIHEYYYDGNQLSLEVIRNGDTIEQYRYYQWDGYTPLGMIIREKDVSGDWKEQVYHYWTNHRGDVVSIRDQEGKDIGSYSYDAYGNVLTEVGDAAKVNPIRYAGYYYDEETKNYYLQARYYNPENGAFLALDPYPGNDGNPISQNGYNYANNNPVMYFDPDGHWAWKGISNKTFARTIDIGIAVWSGGSAYMTHKAAVKLIKANRQRITRTVEAQLIKYAGKKWAYLASTVVNVALIYIDKSIGDAIAYAVDRVVDPRIGKRSRNGKVFY